MSQGSRKDVASSSSATRSNKPLGVPIEPPLPGSTYEPKQSSHSRTTNKMTPSWLTPGKDTLHTSKSTPRQSERKREEITPASFYGPTGSSTLPRSACELAERAGLRVQGEHTVGLAMASFTAASVSGFAVGTPANRKLSLQNSSPEMSPAQYRNAAKNGAVATSFSTLIKAGRDQRAGRKMVGKHSSPVIEISDDDDDDDKGESSVGGKHGQEEERSAPQERGRISMERDSQSPSLEVCVKPKHRHNPAIIPGRIKRHSQSPENGFSREPSAAVGDEKTLTDEKHWRSNASSSTSTLTHLDESRNFKIYGAVVLEKPKLQNGMKDKHGKVVSDRGKVLGNEIKASLIRKEPTNGEPSTKQLLEVKAQELRLVYMGLLDAGSFKDANEPSLRWNTKGHLTLCWKMSDNRIRTIHVPPVDVLKFEYSSADIQPTMTVCLHDPSRIMAELIDRLEITGSADLGEVNDKILLVMPSPYTRHSDTEAWHNLLDAIKTTGVDFSTYNAHLSTLVKSEAHNLPDFMSLSSKATSGRPRPRPVAKAATADRSWVNALSGPRQSLRLRGKGVDSDEEEGRAVKASEEPVLKAAASKDGARQRLRYPFLEPGGVTAFQSDLDKLGDREFLNDTIIELGLKYLLEQIKERDSKLHAQIYVFSSFFYKRISEKKRDRKTTYELVKKWTKKVDIFEKKFLVVPINESLHWYLAILTNPYYSVRAVESKKKLCPPRAEIDEKVDEKSGEGSVALAESSGTSTKRTVDTEPEAARAIRRDAEDDTYMAEGSTVEASPESSTRQRWRAGSAEIMDVDDKNDGNDDDEVRRPFQDISSDELEDNLPKRERATTVVVTDMRSKLPRSTAESRTQNRSGNGDEDFTLLHHSPASTGQNRLTVSDSLNNRGRGSLRGGGGGNKPATPIIPGSSFSHNEPESSSATRKRKADEDEVTSSSLPSPPRSRSGATYGGRVSYTRRQIGEHLHDKHREWLEDKAVVCVFDSLGTTHRGVRTALREYLCLEYNDKRGGEIEPLDVELEHIDVKAPIQGNYCDCGLYLLHAFERFFSDPAKMMEEVIPSRDEKHTYWRAEEATTKRAWWRDRVSSLADEWEAQRERVKAEREAQKAADRAAAGSNTPPPAAADSQAGSDVFVQM